MNPARAGVRELAIGSRRLVLPAFFPDATRAVVRSLDGEDLRRSGVEGVVVNAYHLMTSPGASVVERMGGAAKFMNWDGFVVSDSGGFQLLSLIYRDKSYGTISRDGVLFRRGARGKIGKYKLTPEDSIRIQFELGADIMFCLDDCPPANAGAEAIRTSVSRTIEWAARCKEEYARRLGDPGDPGPGRARPLLFAVIQGGDDEKLRETCYRGLERIGFDGYGFGGWPLDRNGGTRMRILDFTAALVPDDKVRFALGVGNPGAVVDCFRMGYGIFDCSLPTRDARHKRLYVFSSDPGRMDPASDREICRTIYIDSEEYVRDARPVSEWCDCLACSRHSRAYLRHLFEIGDSLGPRLATMHNLRTYTLLMERLRAYA